MVIQLRCSSFSPIFCAALGTAAGFYLCSVRLPIWLLSVLLVMAAALCFFYVLFSLYPWHRSLRLTVVYSAAVVAGLVLGISAASAGRNVVKFALPEDRITGIEGILLEDPRIISGNRAMAVLSLRRCTGAGGLRASGSGDLTVFFPEESAGRIREFGRGTVIFTEGRLRHAEAGWTFGAESLHIVKPAPAIERMRTSIRLNLIDRFYGKNWGGLALAMLIGVRDNLDTNLTAMYRNAGLSYILALSGMHLAVLVSLITFLLKKPLGLKPAAIAGALIICLYCFFVGPMPSLNRAAIMYLLGVLAILGALPRESMSVLALSFLIQIIISPASGNTISFILSYLAMLGILIVGKPLRFLFLGRIPDFLLNPLAVSCGAFLATAGVTCYVFGIIAPAGIIAGLVVVPATTVFMIGSIIWLVLDMFSFSGFLNFPMTLFYQFMEQTVFLTGRAPGISPARPFLVIGISMALSLLIVALEYRRRTAMLRLQPFS